MTSQPSDAPSAVSGLRAAIRSIAALNAAMVLVATASALVLASGALALGSEVGGAVVVLGLIAALIVPAWGLARSGERGRVVGGATALFAGVVVLAGGSSTSIYDSSWDGRDYQQYSIHRIANGFNPIRDTAAPPGNYRNLALNHYPKAPWYLGAATRNLTGRMEGAKALNLILAWGAACLAFLALEARPWATLADSALLAALVSMNPVITTQLFTNYVDGLGASILTMLFAVSALLLVDLRRWRLLELGMILIIGVNVKFTTTATMAFFLPLLLFGVARHHRWQTTGSLLRTALAGGLVAVLLVGYSPYVRNTLEQGNPLYPTLGSAYGTNASSILGPQIRPGFMDHARPTRLAISFFAESMNDPSGEVALKLPLQASRAEFRQFVDPDVRVGGFGPWFGAGLLLALAGSAAWADRRHRRAIAGVALVLVASALIHDGGWWARYAPQLWLIPAFALAVPWPGGKTAMPGRPAAGPSARLLILSLALANAAGVAGSAWTGSIRSTSRTNATLEEVQRLADTGTTILVFPSHFIATEYMLTERTIPYMVVDSEEGLPCPRRLTRGTAYSPAHCLAATQDDGSPRP